MSSTYKSNKSFVNVTMQKSNITCQICGIQYKFNATEMED